MKDETVVALKGRVLIIQVLLYIMTKVSEGVKKKKKNQYILGVV